MTDLAEHLPALSAYARDAARAIWLVVRAEGLTSGHWGYDQLPAACANLPQVEALTVIVSAIVGEDPAEAEPVQLLLRLPDPQTDHARIQYEPHIDRTPSGDLYRRVMGCCLSDAPGGTVDVRGETIGYRQGEVFGWAGEVTHCGRLNVTDTPRLTAYWRWP